MLEHMPNAEEYTKGRLYLFDLGRRIGVDVGNAEERCRRAALICLSAPSKTSASARRTTASPA